MPGISPKLPLTIEKNDLSSYVLNKNLKESVQQNLKNLVLTNPGERIMDSRFGVGIKRFLFENFSPIVKSDIKSSITTQVSRYMPFLAIEEIAVNDDLDSNKLYVTIRYSVANLGIQDILSLDIVRNN